MGGKQDGGWGWLIVATSFYANVVIGVVLTGFSVLYVEWLQVFESDAGSIGWIGSIYLCAGNILSVFFSVFVDVWGCRVVAIVGALLYALGFFTSAFAPSGLILCVTYGFLAGIGAGLVMLTTNIIVLQHFHQRRPLASALSLMGVSVGTLSAGPLLHILIEHYGWRGALLILSGIALNVVVAGLTYRPNSEKCNKESSILERIEDKCFDGSTCRQLPFLMCMMGNLCMAIGHFPVYSHTPNRAVDYGIERSRAVLLPSYIGLASFLSRLVFGFVANLPGVNRILQYGGGIALTGLLQLLYIFAESYVSMSVWCSAFGILVGCFLTVQSTVLVDLVGVERLPKAQGTLFMILGVGSLIGTPAAGYIFDLTTDYDIPFFITGAIEVLGGALVIGAALYQRSHDTKEADDVVSISA